VVRSPSFAVEDGDDVDYDVKVGVIGDTLRLLDFWYIDISVVGTDVKTFLKYFMCYVCAFLNVQTIFFQKCYESNVQVLNGRHFQEILNFLNNIVI